MELRTRRRGRLRAVVLLCWAMFVWSCRSTPTDIVQLPVKHSVDTEQLLVLSDQKLGRDHGLIRDLVGLRGEVLKSLQLPSDGRKVVVYVFRDQPAYAKYMSSRFPGLPPRRAYFVGTPHELGVYTFWGEQIQQDLRHEFTHGLLHSVLTGVPLWLDEGIAEYFEVVGPPGSANSEYTERLSRAIVNGWRPDIKRLEQLTEVSQMQHNDYQESWAWVHFMLHSSFETRGVLVEYLRDLRTNPRPEALSKRLLREQPGSELRFLNYVASMQTGRYLAQHDGTREDAADETIALDYVPEVPDSAGTRIVLTRFDGTRGIVNERELYLDSHRAGWEECRDLFLGGSIDLEDDENVRAYLNRIDEKDWQTAHRARCAGFEQCRTQLRYLNHRFGLKNVRKALVKRLGGEDDGIVNDRSVN